MSRLLVGTSRIYLILLDESDTIEMSAKESIMKTQQAYEDIMRMKYG